MRNSRPLSRTRHGDWAAEQRRKNVLIVARQQDPEPVRAAVTAPDTSSESREGLHLIVARQETRVRKEHGAVRSVQPFEGVGQRLDDKLLKTIPVAVAGGCTVSTKHGLP